VTSSYDHKRALTQPYSNMELYCNGYECWYLTGLPLLKNTIWWTRIFHVLLKYHHWPKKITFLESKLEMRGMPSHHWHTQRTRWTKLAWISSETACPRPLPPLLPSPPLPPSSTSSCLSGSIVPKLHKPTLSIVGSDRCVFNFDS